MTLLRSLLFNLVFYVVTVVMILAAAPVFAFARPEICMRLVRDWCEVGLFLLRTIAGTRLEVRGLANVPEGGVLIAAKHQSMFETFALLPYLHNPLYVLKRELIRIPFFGWYAAKVGMIPVDRDRGSSALRDLAARVRAALARGAAIVIFPEGTRRPPGAEPAYRGGIAHLYRAAEVPVVPMALNSGLFWGRRKWVKRPGVITLEILPAIPPGLPRDAFMQTLRDRIETATARLVENPQGVNEKRTSC